jgi:hypothetical protein
MAELLDGTVVQALLMGMPLSPDQGLGVDALFMGQIRLSTPATQPTAQAAVSPLTISHPSDVVGVTEANVCPGIGSGIEHHILHG